jgi:DNA-binding MarR family transcriptional regulator
LLRRLQTSVSRLLAKLGEHPAFGESGLGFTEWLFLRALKEDTNLRSGAIAQRLGITAQRSTQIVAALKQAGLVTVAPSAKDSRKKDLQVSQLGANKLNALDETVMAVFSSAINGRPKAILTVSKFSQGVLRQMGGKPRKGPKRGAKVDKDAENED